MSKISNLERAGGEAPVEEHLPCICEAMSSNPSTAKKTPKEQTKNSNAKVKRSTRLKFILYDSL
jgi:hypothetical protein